MGKNFWIWVENSEYLYNLGNSGAVIKLSFQLFGGDCFWEKSFQR